MGCGLLRFPPTPYLLHEGIVRGLLNFWLNSVLALHDLLLVSVYYSEGGRDYLVISCNRFTFHVLFPALVSLSSCIH